MNVNEIFNVLLFQHLFLFLLARSKVAPTHLLVTRVGPCHINRQSVVTVSELNIRRNRYDFTLRGNFNITRDIENGWILRGTMQKCQDIRNVDTCDYLKSFTVVDDGCIEADHSEENVFGFFIHFTRPIIPCPIKAGEYSIIDYPFYTEDNYLIVSEAKLSSSVFGYTLRLEAYSDEEKLMCIDAYLRLLYVRKHDWLKKGKLNNTEVNETPLSDEAE